MKKRINWIVFSAVGVLAVLLFFVRYNTISDLTRDAPSACAIHGVVMTKRLVPIHYGLPTEAAFEEFKTSSEKFPNSHEYLFGGYEVGSTKKARVYRCEQCVNGRKQWNLTTSNQ